MKHCKRLLILPLLLLLSMTAACGETVLATWTEGTPARLVCTGERWYAMLGSYGRNDATLAVGDAPDSLGTVYTDEAKVWSFEATPTHAAWVQIAEDTLSWMLYDHASGQVTEVWREADVDKRPCVTLALDEQAMYLSAATWRRRRQPCTAEALRTERKSSCARRRESGCARGCAQPFMFIG